jgi:steroid 5-alpha reductase family enzyme
MADIPAAFVQPVQFMVFNIAWTYLASVVTGNVSQVDRVWTFLPTVYTAYFAFYPLLDWADPSIKSRGVNPRVMLMLGLQVCSHITLKFDE